MTPLKEWFALGTTVALVLATGCSRHANDETAKIGAASARAEDADAFVASANRRLESVAFEMRHGQVAAMYAPAALESKHLALLDRLIEESARFDGQNLKPETSRAIERLRVLSDTPIPHDPAKISELAAVVVRMRMINGVESYCKSDDATSCRSLSELNAVLRSSRDFDERLDAWTLRHSNTAAMRKDYARFVELANEGAKRLGFANTGEYVRARHDMDADELRTQSDHLWSQAKPLYYQLQCYVRSRLVKQYGERAQRDGMIRAHLGAVSELAYWRNQWDLQWDLLAPFPDAAGTTAGMQSEIQNVRKLPTPVISDERPFLLSGSLEYPLTNALFEIADLPEPTPSPDPQAAINLQMRVALDVFTTLAFARSVEYWRWGVFDGSIRPGDYNKAWWAMRAKYEGIAPPSPRDETTFDPGSSFAIALNQSQNGVFLAGYLRFQIDRALCKAANANGPRYGCDLEHDATAGKLYRAMLERGESQPWQKTLKEFTGEDSIDAGALLEYFAPLRAWLERENKGQSCGWEGNFASGAPTAPGSD